MKWPSRKKKKDPITINVVGQLSDIMLGKIVNPKYEDPGSPIVIVNIKNVSMPKNLIDLGEAINVMTRDTMFNLDPQSLLRNTTTILQLADNSIVHPKGILEYVTVCMDSWEYPI